MNKPIHVIDIETNGLLYEATEIHVICVDSYMPGPTGKLCLPIKQLYFDNPDEVPLVSPRTGSIADFYTFLHNKYREGDTIVGHNFVGYDLFVLKKLMDKYVSPHSTIGRDFIDSKLIEQVVDTMLLSQILYPERPASLDYWGAQLGTRKKVHEDWTVLSQDMLYRCMIDVDINYKLYQHLLKAKDRYPTLAIDEALSLETQVSWIHSHQEFKGIRFNIVEARKLLYKLAKEEQELTDEIVPQLPLKMDKLGTIEEPFLKNGTVNKRTNDWFKKDPECEKVLSPIQTIFPIFNPDRSVVKVGGAFSKIEFRAPNLNSSSEIKDLLLSLGWEPTEYNTKRDEDGSIKDTSPKLTEDSFESLPEGLGKLIARLLIVKHRKRWLLSKKGTGALKDFRIPDKRYLKVGERIPEGALRIPARAMTVGTPTSRYRHCGTVCNLPKAEAKVPFGIEIRSLFVASPGCSLLGIDLKGIEAFVMAHFTNRFDSGALGRRVMSVDIHKYNAKVLGCSRGVAKTFLYALSYGAKEVKLASILGIKNKAKAMKIIDDFWKENGGLKALIESLELEYTRNSGVYIVGIDGRPIFVRRKGTVLNSLIQGAAAIVFKKWMVLCAELIRLKYPGKVFQLLAYHDELLFEVSDDLNMEEVKKDLLECVVKAGEFYKLSFPISGDAKVGKNYAEVH